MKELSQPISHTSKAIAIPLQESLGRLRIRRPRVRIDAGAKEEDEDEEAA